MKKVNCNIKYGVLFSFLFMFSALIYSNDKLVVYTAPEGALLNDDFSIRVRQPGRGLAVPNHGKGG